MRKAKASFMKNLQVAILIICITTLSVMGMQENSNHDSTKAVEVVGKLQGGKDAKQKGEHPDKIIHSKSPSPVLHPIPLPIPLIGWMFATKARIDL